MEIFQQVTLRSILWLATLWAVLIVGIIGCGDDVNDDSDDNDWIGTWAIETINGETLEQAFERRGTYPSVVTNSWKFNSNGTFEWELGFKYEPKEEDSKVVGEQSSKLSGTYDLFGLSFALIFTEGTGSANIEGQKEWTGIWSRKGDILTLNIEDEEEDVTILLKKK